MSRRRKPNQPPQQQQQKRRNTGADRPRLAITITFLPDGKVEVDPQFNNALIEQLDVIHEMAEEYDAEWTDDHKIAYYVGNLMDDYLAQWGPPITQEEVDTGVSEIPHIKDAPVIDRFDLADMEPVKK
jgi:hypothetical protein